MGESYGRKLATAKNEIGLGDGLVRDLDAYRYPHKLVITVTVRT